MSDIKATFKPFSNSKLDFGVLTDFLREFKHLSNTNDENVEEGLFETAEEPQSIQLRVQSLNSNPILFEFLRIFQTQQRIEKNAVFVSAPFNLNTLYAQEGSYFINLLNNELRNTKKTISSLKKMAIRLIAKQVYGVDSMFNISEIPLVFFDPHVKQEQFFSAQILSEFTEVTKINSKDEIPLEMINQLSNRNFQFDIDSFPFHFFSFRGLQVWKLRDVCIEEVSSQLRKLLVYHSDEEQPLQEDIERYLSIATGLPELKLSFHEYAPEYLGESLAALIHAEYKTSILFKAIQHGSTLIIEDFSKTVSGSLIDQGIIKHGTKSLLLVPVFDEKEKPIGVIKIGDANKKSFSHAMVEDLEEILLLLRLYMNRQKQNRENTIKRLIQTYYTNIHPSIQWKFNEAALQLYAEQKKGDILTKGIPSIKCENVNALYAQADIIGSSTLRNNSIIKDLLENLLLAEELLQTLNEDNQQMSSLILEKVKSYCKVLNGPFHSSSEASVMEFLSVELHPYLEELRGKLVKSKAGFIGDYFQKLDPNVGIINRHRKVYEESVNQVNRRLIKLVQQEDQKLQEVLPHYLQHFSTDGIEFDIFLGQSLLEEKTFSEQYLDQFRAWQIGLMCKITKEIAIIQPSLPIGLKTSQLMLWYSNTLDIGFRRDEKKFDIEGSHSVQYEIVKKRIDKALIAGTKDRLTVEGKIAIVFFHPEEGDEIKKICAGLIKSGYLTPTLEELNLEAMQGVRGLKAIRVEVIV